MHLSTINHINLLYIQDFPQPSFTPCVNLRRLDLWYQMRRCFFLLGICEELEVLVGHNLLSPQRLYLPASKEGPRLPTIPSLCSWLDSIVHSEGHEKIPALASEHFWEIRIEISSFLLVSSTLESMRPSLLGRVSLWRNYMRKIIHLRIKSRTIYRRIHVTTAFLF